MALIYAIKSYQTDKIYIGSTTKTLDERFLRHKSDHTNANKYVTSSEILKFGDAYIELIEECSCEVQFERERFHIKENKNNVVNIQVPCRTWEEYYKDNREHRIANTKAYVETHKEERKAYHKTWREANKDKLKAYGKAWRLSKKINEQK
jgi:hypothetical protein